jgi:hypothetical protein
VGARWKDLATGLAAIMVTAFAPSCGVAAQGGQESALEMESWCRPFLSAAVLPDGSITFASERGQADECWGAFAAIQQLSDFLDSGGKPVLAFCPPPAVTRLELIKVYMAYSQRHPAAGHLHFTQVALAALQEAFPCSAKR